MVTAGLLGMIGVSWLLAGLAMIAVPSWWTQALQRWFAHPSYRFLGTQAGLLAGLVLVLGTSGHQGSWFWMVIGAVAILKSMFLMGASTGLSERVMTRWAKLPSWTLRLCGLLLLVVSSLLAIDTSQMLS